MSGVSLSTLGSQGRLTPPRACRPSLTSGRRFAQSARAWCARYTGFQESFWRPRSKCPRASSPDPPSHQTRSGCGYCLLRCTPTQAHASFRAWHACPLTYSGQSAQPSVGFIQGLSQGFLHGLTEHGHHASPLSLQKRKAWHMIGAAKSSMGCPE